MTAPALFLHPTSPVGTTALHQCPAPGRAAPAPNSLLARTASDGKPVYWGVTPSPALSTVSGPLGVLQKFAHDRLAILLQVRWRPRRDNVDRHPAPRSNRCVSPIVDAHPNSFDLDDLDPDRHCGCARPAPPPRSLE